MSKEEITYKDLSKRQLEDLKDIYIVSRLESMSTEDLSTFVRTIITDQVKSTVGNEEEREVWKEIKEFFGDNFESQLKIIIKNKDDGNEKSPEQEELEKRLKLLEQRKNESNKENQDMW